MRQGLSHKKLWAQMLNRSSGVSILKNETQRLFYHAPEKFSRKEIPIKSLDYVYELSQKYLIEVETK